MYLKLIKERRERQSLQDILVLLYVVTLSVMPKDLERENRACRWPVIDQLLSTINQYLYI